MDDKTYFRYFSCYSRSHNDLDDDNSGGNNDDYSWNDDDYLHSHSVLRPCTSQKETKKSMTVRIQQPFPLTSVTCAHSDAVDNVHAMDMTDGNEKVNDDTEDEENGNALGGEEMNIYFHGNNRYNDNTAVPYIALLVLYDD